MKPPGVETSGAASALAQTFAVMRAAQRREPFPNWPTRARRLHALAELISEHRAEINVAISADFGRRPAEETELLEMFPSVSAISHALKHGRRWMRSRRRWAGFWFLPARTELLPQPLGVVGIIVPWNYPLYLAIGPLIDALAAGNRVLVKMSELTPRFSALFGELVARYFTPEEVAVVNGGADVGRAFAVLPLDHLLFTGSTAVGREVMRAAAANLTPVTLELGGKSPAIIGPDARFEHAVERILVGKLLNAGQTCIAPDYVLLPRGRVSEFIDVARTVVAKLYPDYAANTQYASIVSDRHYAWLQSLRETARAGGANVQELIGNDGSTVSSAIARSTTTAAKAVPRIFAPALLTNVSDDMPIMRQEIFGPLLPLVPYDHVDDALTYIATHPHPLALYVFDENRATVDRVLSCSLAGGVTVNDTLLHLAQHNLPFGGLGASGMGAYHGEAGFRTFSHIKPVLRQARWNAIGLFNPPYSGMVRRMLKLILRH